MKLTEYEKYQLQWMIDHDISLDELIDCLNAREEYEELLEIGFSNGMCFVCYGEWKDFDCEQN